MRIGIPSETKTLERPVALIPAAAADLLRHGHEVLIQSGADQARRREGMSVLADAGKLVHPALQGML